MSPIGIAIIQYMYEEEEADRCYTCAYNITTVVCMCVDIIDGSKQVDVGIWRLCWYVCTSECECEFLCGFHMLYVCCNHRYPIFE